MESRPFFHWFVVILIFLATVVAVMAVVTMGGKGIIKEYRIVGGQETEISRISFNGNIGYDKNDVPKGKWQMSFQKLGTHVLNGERFSSDTISDIEFINDASCPIPEGAPYNVIKFTATGHVNKDYKWVAYITLTDFEAPAEVIDGVRIILDHPTESFDSSEGYFTSDHVFSGCVEDKITKIDTGNLRMH